jgi:hypothetical protein
LVTGTRRRRRDHTHGNSHSHGRACQQKSKPHLVTALHSTSNYTRDPRTTARPPQVQLERFVTSPSWEDVKQTVSTTGPSP